jgi:uncharacterized protein (TIGR01619 family)
MKLFSYLSPFLYPKIITRIKRSVLKNIVLCVFCVSICASVFAQDETENWETYLASYENGKPGSTTVRMDMIEKAPIEGHNYVVITGVNYKSGRKDGLPENDATFNELHTIANALKTLLNKETDVVAVGAFTYNFEHLEYFYLKSDAGIKEKIEAFYITNYPDKTYYLNIEEDKKWEHYTTFLYPNAITQNYMTDVRLVNALKAEGDNLKKARRVDHWMYFRTKEDLDRFKETIQTLNFKIEFSGSKGVAKFPYSLQFYKYSKVDMNTINAITTSLVEMTKNYNATYDGWETK